MLCPVEPPLAMHKAVKTMMETFLSKPSAETIVDVLTPFEEFNAFIGLQKLLI